MNPAQLLAHFDRISETPDAVARLRRFIFDLAMRGKLLEQNPDDEPAAETLRRAQRKLPAVISVQQVPENWINTPLQALAANTRYPIGDGDHGQIKPACYQQDGVPYIRVADIGWGTFEPNGLVYIPEEVHQQNLKSELLPGDILIAKTGATIGKCCILPESIPRANTTSSVGKVTVDQDIVLPKWVIYYFLSGGFKEKMWAVSKKTAQPGFNISNLKQFVVPLPPLAEQNRIIAKVDELMVLCDQLEAANIEREARRDRLVAASLNRIGTAPVAADEATTAAASAISLRDAARFHLDHLPRLTTRPEHITQLRQTILNLAVCGRLVPQDPNDEPAAEQLKRIGVTGINTDMPSFTVGDKQTDRLPATWECVELSRIATVGTGTTPSRGIAEFFTPPEIPWVTSGETSAPYIKSTEQHVSGRALRETSLKLYPIGTLLVAMYGQGKTRGQITELCIEATTNQACAAIVLTLEDKFHRRYIKLYFQKIYEEIRKLSAGGAQPNLNVGKVKSTLIPFPPLAEQKRIVAKVDELMALCDQLEAQLTATTTHSRRLLEAVLHEALAPPSLATETVD